MVRTRADNCARKAVAAKAPRKILGSSSGGAGSSSGMTSPAGKVGKYAGGNIVCPRPTPDWQKGISGFFTPTPNGKENSKPKDHDGDEEEEEREEEVMVEAGEGSASATTAAATSDGAGSQSSNSSSQDSAGPSSPRRQRNGIIDSDSDDE